ncbi:hypothetical protein [Streptomyces albidoflavus]|uniref:hypothetical protein n=1 Tax=Streptomyces albidoflavus TaxID=1886 RepID=UPI0033E3586A
MTTRILDYGGSGVTVGIVPRACGSCGSPVDRVTLSLDAVTPGTTDFLGIRAIATTPCCNTVRSAAYPVETLARLLNHLETCPNCSEEKH